MKQTIIPDVEDIGVCKAMDEIAHQKNERIIISGDKIMKSFL